MDLKDTCTLLLQRGTQKVKCFKFMSKEIGRELALHEDVDTRGHSSITDVKTGIRLTGIAFPPKQIKETDIQARLEWFVKHFTLESIAERFEEEDQTSMQEKLDKRKKK